MEALDTTLGLDLLDFSELDAIAEETRVFGCGFWGNCCIVKPEPVPPDTTR